MKPISSTSIDDRTKCITLEIPTSKIVFFQALVESYEGIGIVRTPSPDDPTVSILTTNDMEGEVMEFLSKIEF